MPGDGVSLPTTLAQMGSVAKTQAKGQQVSPQVNPFSGQKENEEELRVERVKETTASDKNRIAGEDQEKDKRKRRRLKRRSKRLEQESEQADRTEGAAEGSPSGDEDKLGSLIDLHV